MKPKSGSLRYLEEECPALLTGALSKRVRALSAWAESQQDQGRAGIYRRVALVVALTSVFRFDRDFICALTSKPVSLKKIKKREAVRVFMVAVNNYGPAPTRAQQQSTSRDVRAVLYLLTNKIPPNEVCDLAKRNGEGVHAWAEKFTQKKPLRKSARGIQEPDVVSEVTAPNEVEITIKIGGGEARHFKRELPHGKIDVLEQFVEKLMEQEEEY